MKDYLIEIEDHLCEELQIDELSEDQRGILFDFTGEYFALGYSAEFAAQELLPRISE